MNGSLEAEWAAATPIAAPKEDLEKLWASATPVARREKTGALEAGGRGAGQGLTLGFGDELNGLIQAGLEGIQNPETKQGFWDRYRKNRDTFRNEDARAQEDQGGAFLAGNVLGGSALTPLGGAALGKLAQAAPGVANALTAGGQLRQLVTTGAALGGTEGLGMSGADLTRGELGRAALDTALGAGVGASSGLAAHGIESGLGAAGRWLGKRATGMEARADAKIIAAGKEAVAGENEAFRSKAGREATAGYKQARNVTDANALETLTPSQAAAHGQLMADLGESGAQGLEEGLARKNSSEAAYHEALASTPQREAAAIAEHGKPTIKKDLQSYLKAYAEPMVAAYAGNRLGEMVDQPGLGTAAGVVFGRTRAGKALMSRVLKPGNQKAFAALLRGAAGAAESIAPRLGRAEAIAGRSLAPIGPAQSGAFAIPAIANLFDSEDDQRQAIVQALLGRQ